MRQYTMIVNKVRSEHRSLVYDVTGKVIAQGTHATLTQARGWYCRLLEKLGDGANFYLDTSSVTVAATEVDDDELVEEAE